ncbi:MAG: phosphoglycolate phosphatase [Thermoplasmatota archaeon]|nr:phosphoglycolate phosphatase [Candidatus Thermoplasmatota archaeon]MBU1914402.1 phosphoglycolate phosphatase [Candidatus Thermoplasmatota archaeon]
MPRQGSVKALAVDVDGTLTDDSRRVNLDAVRALREVQDSGVPVMLASGNVLPIAYSLSNYLGFNGPIVAENGGVVSYNQQTLVLGNPEKPRKAYEHLRTKMDVERLFTDKWRETEVGLKSEVSLEGVRDVLKDWDVDVQTTGWAVHIMEKGMNKFVGVKKACGLLGITPKDVAAFGDSDNDEMMIRECGWGIAVGNAFEGTKKAASFVANGLNGAGVVEGLVWLGLIKR